MMLCRFLVFTVITLLGPCIASSEMPPTHKRQSTRDWAQAIEKANAALQKLSASEKIGIVSGVGWNKGKCVGNTHAASSINFPSLCVQDGPLGVRYAKSATAFPPGIQAASTWDIDLMYKRGVALGEEFKGVGAHVMLGPAIGALGKIPQGGRNWEGFGVDPYLAGITMIQTVQGVQSVGVQACAKHYILNEQEKNRDSMNTNADERTLRELYLWPFADSVRAGVASVMCSYNKVGSEWACENKKILVDVLKNELAFNGYVMSDWGAQHTTAGSANGGLDMTMPGSNYDGTSGVLWMDKLQQAISQNQVQQSRVDDMVKRILTSWYYLGQDSSYPSVDLGRNVQGNHKDIARAVARDGIVLLKNENASLPLKTTDKLAIIGSAAVVNPSGMNACADRGCNTGALGMGWGSGTVDYPYFSAPYDAIRSKASNTMLSSNDNPSQGASAAQSASTAIVFITANSGEGYIEVERNSGDRIDLNPWHSGNDLVAAVAKTGKPTIVVVHSVGPIILETILQQPNVVAIVWAGLPGQESGNALADVLFGSTNPNGKLPYTIGKTAQDYGTQVVSGEDNFREGLYIDYRYFDKNNIQPRYEFGFGLSYTKFNYSSLTVTKSASLAAGPASSTKTPGGPSNHYDEVATVTAEISNVGSVAGAEAAQLYITYPSSAPETPVRQLRSFAKVKVDVGKSATATFKLRRKDLSYWDTSRQNWVVPSGEFKILVGASSRDTKLQGTLVV